MKDFLITLIGISVLLFSSCSKSSMGGEPTIHDSIEIDLNEDGIEDFTIQYSGVDIDPISSSDGTYGISGRLRPLGKNEILRHLEDGYLFLRNLDDVDKNVIEPLQWRSVFSGAIVSIYTKNAEGDWPSKWKINSDDNQSSYFFGLKLVSDFDIQLGWIEIDINKNDGSVSVVDKGLL